jgi:hypothetical protein
MNFMPQGLVFFDSESQLTGNMIKKNEKRIEIGITGLNFIKPLFTLVVSA